MSSHNITTPRGSIVQTTTNSGKVKAELTWNPDFSPKRTQSFNRAQKFVDSEVLRYCSALVPFQTGMLDRSGKLGTVIGSGLVQYIAPYAAAQYYDTATSRPYDANRGAQWFERMKVAYKRDILDGAKKML